MRTEIIRMNVSIWKYFNRVTEIIQLIQNKNMTVVYSVIMRIVQSVTDAGFSILPDSNVFVHFLRMKTRQLK